MLHPITVPNMRQIGKVILIGAWLLIRKVSFELTLIFLIRLLLELDVALTTSWLFLGVAC